MCVCVCRLIECSSPGISCADTANKHASYSPSACTSGRGWWSDTGGKGAAVGKLFVPHIPEGGSSCTLAKRCPKMLRCWAKQPAKLSLNQSSHIFIRIASIVPVSMPLCSFYRVCRKKRGRPHAKHLSFSWKAADCQRVIRPRKRHKETIVRRWREEAAEKY